MSGRGAMMYSITLHVSLKLCDSQILKVSDKKRRAADQRLPVAAN
jgi:hypothetical protein